MNTTNGKLLGQAQSELKFLKKQLEDILLTEQQKQQELHQEDLERIYLLLQIVGKKVEKLEKAQVNCLENNLAVLKKYIPTKLLLLVFLSSLISGITSLCSWLDIKPPEQLKLDGKATAVSILDNREKESRSV